jgi:hypothetical protein
MVKDELLIEYITALKKIKELVREDNTCCGGWTDPEGALESIADIVEGLV